MNRFHFRLENVLRVRGVEEEAKKRDFGVARQKVQNEKNRLDDICREIREHDLLAEGRKGRPLNAQELIIHHRYSTQLEQKRESQLKLLKQAEDALAVRRNELVEATRRKKTLERLRERALREYEQAENKEEQNILDEMTIQKYKNASDYNA